MIIVLPSSYTTEITKPSTSDLQTRAQDSLSAVLADYNNSGAYHDKISGLQIKGASNDFYSVNQSESPDVYTISSDRKIEFTLDDGNTDVNDVKISISDYIANNLLAKVKQKSPDYYDGVTPSSVLALSTSVLAPINSCRHSA